MYSDNLVSRNELHTITHLIVSASPDVQFSQRKILMKAKELYGRLLSIMTRRTTANPFKYNFLDAKPF